MRPCDSTALATLFGCPVAGASSAAAGVEVVGRQLRHQLMILEAHTARLILARCTMHQTFIVGTHTLSTRVLCVEAYRRSQCY